MTDFYESKHGRPVELREIDNEIHNLEYDHPAAKKWATLNDIRDINALGLNPTFRRRFKFIAMVGFSSTVVVAWQNTLATFYFALYNGGTFPDGRRTVPMGLRMRAAVVVTMWVTSPRASVQDTIFSFINPAGWENAGVASMIGVLTPWSSLAGYDSSVHMNENAKDASRTIPLSLMTAYGINSILAFVAGVTMVFCIGNVDQVIAAPSPFIAIFLNSTGSKAAGVVLTVPIILAFYSAAISQIATASRQLWSFARDGGLPGGSAIEPVPDAETPRRAVWLTAALASCITCINFGPVVGFNAIISLVICALTTSYTLTIGCTI